VRNNDGVSRDPEVGLMIKAARGDETAFEQLVDRSQDALVQYLTRLCGRPALAEDLAQDTYVKLYAKRRRYRPLARFRTFLYRIAHNLWIDYLRKHRLSASSLDEMRSGSEIPDRKGIGAEIAVIQSDLMRAVDRLPLGQRQVLLLHLIEGLNYAEISGALEIPRGTVKSRMYHAVRKLRAVYESEVGHERP